MKKYIYIILCTLILSNNVHAIKTNLNNADINEAITIAKDNNQYNNVINNEWAIYNENEKGIIITPFLYAIIQSKDMVRKYIEPTIEKINYIDDEYKYFTYINITAIGNQYNFLEDAHIIIKYENESIIQPLEVKIHNSQIKSNLKYENTISGVFNINHIINEKAEIILIYKNGKESFFNVDFVNIR